MSGPGGSLPARTARRFSAASRPILVHSNAGIPKLSGKIVVYDETPEVMAAKIKDLVEAGAQIVGGCCGTTPEHIRAFRRELDKLKG